MGQAGRKDKDTSWALNGCFKDSFCSVCVPTASPEKEAFLGAQGQLVGGSPWRRASPGLQEGLDSGVKDPTPLLPRYFSPPSAVGHLS